MDEQARHLKNAWKTEERNVARIAFPLPNAALAALFDSVDVGLAAMACDHSLRITREWLSRAGHDVGAVVAWLEQNGGFCDCEVAANSRDHWEQNKD